MDKRQRTLGIVKPCGCEHTRDILLMINEHGGLKVVDKKLVHWTREEVDSFYPLGSELHMLNREHMSSGPMTIMLLEGVDAVSNWKLLMGAPNAREARAGTIRGRFGQRLVMPKTIVCGSNSIVQARSDIEFVFGAEAVTF